MPDGSEKSIHDTALAVMDKDAGTLHAEVISEIHMVATDAQAIIEIEPGSDHLHSQVERMATLALQELHTGEIILPAVDGMSEQQVAAEVAAVVVAKALADVDPDELPDVEKSLRTKLQLAESEKAVLAARVQELEARIDPEVADLMAELERERAERIRLANENTLQAGVITKQQVMIANQLETIDGLTETPPSRIARLRQHGADILMVLRQSAVK